MLRCAEVCLHAVLNMRFEKIKLNQRFFKITLGSIYLYIYIYIYMYDFYLQTVAVCRSVCCSVFSRSTSEYNIGKITLH